MQLPGIKNVVGGKTRAGWPQGIWFLLFQDRENTEFCSDTWKNLLIHGKYLDCYY